MTVTSPDQGASAARRRLGSRIARAAVALGVALLLVVPTAAVAATAPSPTPTPTTGDVSITLAPVGNGVVRPGESLAVAITVHNDTAAPLPAATVTLAAGARPFADRDDLTAWLGSQQSADPITPVASATVDTVPAGATVTVGIQVAATDAALLGRATGVYPLAADYRGSTELTSSSALIVPDDTAAPVDIGIVVPITAPATSAALLTAEQLIALTSPDGALTAQLDSVEDTPTILAVDPAIPAAIRALGSAAPPTATAWLARLESLGNSRFALQFGDADVAAQLEAGLPRPLTVTSLQALLKPKDFTPSSLEQATATPTPSPSADPAAPVYPDLTTLLDIGGARTGVYWPVTGTATPAVVSTLGPLKDDDHASVILVPSSSTNLGAKGDTVPAHLHAGSADVLAYDADVSRELLAASVMDETAARGAPLTAATAYLAFASAETAGRPLLVTVDRASDRSRILRTVIATATQAGGVRPVSLASIVNSEPVDATIQDAAGQPERAAATVALTGEETQLQQFATILDDPTQITGPERAEILQLLGAGWRDDDATWATAVTTHRTETVTTLGSVRLLAPSTVQLITSDATLRFSVRNDLPYPVNVVLSSTPDDLRLEIEQSTSVAAGAASNTPAPVRVKARVGSGDVGIDLQLYSPTGVPIGGLQVANVTVRAAWESIGIIGIIVIVVGLIVVGFVRTLLRRRRMRQAPTEAEDPADAVAETRADADAEQPSTSRPSEPDE